MKCVLITSSSDTLPGAEELHRLGYKLEVYPVVREESALTDERTDEFIPFINRHPSTTERGYVRSLRATFVKMLEDPRYLNENLIIFGESDAYPQIDSAILKKSVEKELIKHPDTDVLRVYNCVQLKASQLPKSEEIQFKNYKTNNVDLNNPYVWGTHALIIPANKRKKVAKIFRTYRLPTDIALEAANSNGDLSIRVAEYDWFYQQKRYPLSEDKKIAVCLHSYKRLPDLQRQILCMLDQEYKNLHLFVAAKGMPESTFNKMLKESFQHFIEEGRLTLRLFSNKNQLSNFIDTIRGIDISEYDLFAKIDDDDFYGRDYFKIINQFHKALPEHFSSYYSDVGDYLSARDGAPYVDWGNYSAFGPTMIISKSAMNKLIACELTPEQIKQISPSAKHSGYGFTEDNFMDIIMSETGSVNRAAYVNAVNPTLNLAVQISNTSVMRGGLLKQDFRDLNGFINNEKNNEEQYIEIHHPAWRDILRILGKIASRATNDDIAEVLDFNDNIIQLKWDKWGIEEFQKTAKGFYELNTKNN